MANVVSVTCDYQINPIGVTTANPNFSWKIETTKNDTMQTHYQFQLSTDETFASSLWDTDEVESDHSVHLSYEGEPLASASKYYYRVKIKTTKEDWSNWSEIHTLVTSIFKNSELKGSFITAETEEDAGKSFASLYRKRFEIKKPIEAAYLYSSSKGMHKSFLNGEIVGDSVLSPGWTEYQKRLLFLTHDVTNQIQQGENVLSGEVGSGWYKGDLASWLGKRNIYGKVTALYQMLKIVYKDGSIEEVITDGSWKTAPSPIVYSELYHGETFDATMIIKGWNEPSFSDDSWANVQVESADLSVLTPHDGVVVKRQKEFAPIEIFTTPEGERIVDFGQNISGWVRFQAKGNKGEKVVLRHGEILDANGNFYTANLRSAKQRVEYICSGEGTESYEPSFTFQGFRYVSVDEFPGDFDKNTFTAVAIYSDMDDTGDFACSNELVNQLISNIRWGMRDNFVDIPTDCPQRDERLGWTGDAQVFARTAGYLKNTALFFRKWMRDLEASQYADGGVPHVVPDVLQDISLVDKIIRQDYASCGWGDAAVIIPWVVYKYFDDKNILKDQYDSMRAWVEYIYDNATGGVLWDTGFHFGDWVALDAEEGSYFGATPNALTATAYYAYSVSLMEKTAKVMGNKADEARYNNLFDEIKAAYQKEFINHEGNIKARTQTAQILTLHFGLAPKEYEEKIVNTLVDLLHENGNALTTGFLGTPYLCHVLSDHNRLDVAYGLLLKTGYPSWLYQVTKGATTVWEHWDGMKEDGTMWSDNMNSFNHYAYGAVFDWIFSVVGGIDSSEKHAGYKEIIIRPCPTEQLSYAKASYESAYGRIATNWTLEDQNFSVTVEIPPNTKAKIILPQTETSGQIEGFTTTKEGYVKEVGSGNHKFEYRYK